MLDEITIESYYSNNKWLPVVDVRSPREFEKGHIPGAINIPLFSNEERARVGTIYVQKSREKAIELGYKFVTPKLQHFIDASRAVAPDGKIVIHCWRGGMRSQSFAKHLHDNNFSEVHVIHNGYKAYRHMVLNLFAQPWNLKVVGGYTGAGKTHLLHYLDEQNHQTIDLEGLAHHKGSVFGGIGQPEQPTSEQFENNLYEKMRLLNPAAPLFIEDESLKIGKVSMPQTLYQQIRSAMIYFIDVPREERALLLANDYNFDNIEPLANAIIKITKRLGGLETKQALELLYQRKFYEVALTSLNYYDKTYLKGLQDRDPNKIRMIPCCDTTPSLNAQRLLDSVKQDECITTN
ncbi:tRNA 2-selenouridine(34) synthase MnmH [Geofilum sp. OHC36d9]|uniref:tRNA 2-selenouridine(34) synthase MnmH n=1 Tax=Geofilum sp. OHC36d9 TaxID=3458413 RepID=UPI0040334657